MDLDELEYHVEAPYHPIPVKSFSFSLPQHRHPWIAKGCCTVSLSYPLSQKPLDSTLWEPCPESHCTTDTKEAFSKGICGKYSAIPECLTEGGILLVLRNYLTLPDKHQTYFHRDVLSVGKEKWIPLSQEKFDQSTVRDHTMKCPEQKTGAPALSGSTGRTEMTGEKQVRLQRCLQSTLQIEVKMSLIYCLQTYSNHTIHLPKRYAWKKVLKAHTLMKAITFISQVGGNELRGQPKILIFLFLT